MTRTYCISFWNLENLFDVEDSPRRTEKLQRTIGKDLKGWTQDLLDKKVSQLASIIRKMNNGRGPDILCMSEMENEYVLNLLVTALSPLGRSYAVKHHDMSDQRGIDVGFIYDETSFRAEADFSHFVVRRTATRDLYQVNFRSLRTNRLFILIGNHWPSRSGQGPLQTAAYRAIAGETLAYFHQRIYEETSADVPILAMGDFNDEPSDASLVDYALSTRGKTKVINSEVPRFQNLMWELMGKGVGTLYFDNFANVFDQFLANKNLVKESGTIRVIPESVEILRFPEMVDGGEYPKPIPFGGMGKPVNTSGFSDHFPISVMIEEED